MLQQAGHTQGDLHLRTRAVRNHAVRHVESLDERRCAIDRTEPSFELHRHVGSQLVFEIVGQPALPALLDVAQVVRHARPGEPLQRFVELEPGAETGRELDDALGRNPLAVDEHAVAVEQHRVDTPLVAVAWRHPAILR